MRKFPAYDPDREYEERGITVTASEHSPDPITVGRFVRESRKAAGLTQRELADLVSVGVRFISELERDKPTLRMDVVNKVLAAFGKQLGIAEAKREELT